MQTGHQPMKSDDCAANRRALKVMHARLNIHATIYNYHIISWRNTDTPLFSTAHE